MSIVTPLWCYLQGAAKRNQLKLFPGSSATARNVVVKCYKFMWRSYLHLTARQHLITNYVKVIGILTWPLSEFCVLKNVCAEKLQNSVTETTQWTNVWCLTVALCVQNVHHQVLCISSVLAWSFCLPCRSFPVAGCTRSPTRLLWVWWLTWVLDAACDRLRTSDLSRGSPWCLGQANLEASNISDQFQAADLTPYVVCVWRW